MLEDTQFNGHGYNIVNILKRLEHATSRLETLTYSQEDMYNKQTCEAKKAGKERKAGSKDVSRTPKQTSAEADVQEKVKFVRDFESLIKNYVTPFVQLSQRIDGTVGEVSSQFKEAFDEQVRFLEISSRAKRPDMSDPLFMELLQPINEKIGAISAAKDANRRSEYFNHLNTLSDGAPVLGWIVTDTPVSYISEFKDSAQFWANRVVKDFKEKDPAHGQWVKAFYSIFDALRVYVKEYHTTGPSWNGRGESLKEVLNNEASSKSGPGSGPGSDSKRGKSGAPPPPPPPPPANLFDEPASSNTSSGSGSGGLGAVFADLNKGADITSGLKKVDKSQMTHKNPELRHQAPLEKKSAPSKAPSSSSSKTTALQKPPRKELVDGSKWVIENFTAADVSEPIVIEVEKSQSVFIGKTSDITVQIKGKGNAVTISESSKTGVVVDSLISGIDVIKSFKFGVQVTGVVPLISVDKCEEGSIYLSQESVDADSQVISSNTTALNINVLEGDDFVEIPVPEQLTHRIQNGKLVSEVVEHAG